MLLFRSPNHLLPLLFRKPLIEPIGHQIHFIHSHPLGPLQQLPPGKHGRHHRQFNVEAHEVDRLEAWREALPPLHEDQHAVQRDGANRAPRISPISEREQMVEALGFQSRTEAQ